MEEMEEIEWIEVKKHRRKTRGRGDRITLLFIIAPILLLFLFSGFVLLERVKKKHLIDKFVFPQRQEMIVAEKAKP